MKVREDHDFKVVEARYENKKLTIVTEGFEVGGKGFRGLEIDGEGLHKIVKALLPILKGES